MLTRLTSDHALLLYVIATLALVMGTILTLHQPLGDDVVRRVQVPAAQQRPADSPHLSLTGVTGARSGGQPPWAPMRPDRIASIR